MDLDPIFTKTCSSRTIQSDKNGFFEEFFEEVLSMAGSKWLNEKFAKLQSDKEKVLSLFNDPQICDVVLGILEHVKPVFKEKDSTFSVQRRMQGERVFLSGDMKQALALLNQAVMRAPAKGVDRTMDSGLTLASALWTRSGVLLELGEGDRALTDLKQASLHGMETKHRVEYYWRMTKAYALIGDLPKTKITQGITEKLLEGLNDKIDKLREEIAGIRPTGSNVRGTRSKPPQVPKLSGGNNESLIGASKLVKLSSDVDKGKFITAKDNVNTGDVILVEEPIAACLLPNCFGSHCHHCFERLYAPYGCENCSGIAFCSPDCKELACKTYHRYECKFIDLFVGSGMSILCFIAIRMFTQSASVDAALNLTNELIEKLCLHSNIRPAEDYLHRTLMSAFLLRCLQKSEYFGRRKSEAVDPIGKELEVVTAILGLLQLLQFNAHEIYGVLLSNSKHRFNDSKVIYMAAGIYRNGAHFNHDCCPSLARFFIGRTIVLAATRPIKAGCSVSENYGPNMLKLSLKERQRSLKSRYWFRCNCDACRENWPILQKMDKNVRFRCTSPGCAALLNFPKDVAQDVHCSGCRKKISLKESIRTVIKAEEIYRDAAALMKDESTQAAIDKFKEGIDLFHQVAVLPHKDTLIAQESLRTCFADTGTIFIAF